MINPYSLIALFKQALAELWGYIWGTSGEMWTEAKQKALEKTTDSNRAQGRKYGDKWIGHMVADCSGLFSWAFGKLGGYMYHGSDTMYRKYCTDKGELKRGKRTDGKTLKCGTAVFVWNGDTYSHVGLYVGDNTVIEAMSTINGVTTTKVSAGKWTHWGELKGVDYSMSPEDKTTEEVFPTIRSGSKGEYVRKAQQMLKDRGYDLGRCGVDGDYGQATKKAVKQFQKDWGLTQDGVVGPKTWAKLTSTPVITEPAVKKYTATVPGLDLAQVKTLCNTYPGTTYKEMN